ncbi:MAG: phytanoyl-CoA dioxygenase [Planctomycetes bacterium]|nr:phytanoyl-CoA dioxygenase [Planctomycetota bacterium]
MTTGAVAAARHDHLPTAQLEAFHRDGFVVLPDFFAQDLMRDLVREIDELEAGGRATPIYALPTHGMLTSHPDLMAVMEAILGADFLFHHIHTYRHDTGAPGVNWHNDYEQVPQTNRSHLNVIALIYPQGLSGAVGDLAVVPGTQGIVSDWYQLSCFGTETMPGEVVIDRLPPGSVVVAHTGLLHCRRAKPGAGPRYFTDTSYCQRGILWPSWSEDDWRVMLRHCRDHGYDRGGRYRHLYDESQFFDQNSARARIASLNESGSLYPRIG